MSDSDATVGRVRAALTDPRSVIARREVQSLVSEKTIVLALLIQLFIAAFSSFLVVGLVSLYSPDQGPRAVVQTGVAGDDVDDLSAAVENTPGLVVRAYDSKRDARLAFEGNIVDTALLATKTETGTIQVEVLAPDSNIKTTVVVTQVRKALRTYERTQRDERAAYLQRATLQPPPGTSTSTYFGFTYTVLVPLLLFLPVFVGGSITVDSLTEEIDRGTLELLRVAPVSVTEIVEGKLLAALVITPVQALAWMLLLEFNGTPISNLPVLLALVVGATMIAVVGGAALAVVTPDRRVAQTLYSLLTLGLFGVTGLTVLSPLNAAARLAIDSPTAVTYAAVAVVVAVGVGALVTVRRVVPWEAVVTE
ncbi:MAG: ABC transporter permease [Halobaculum sp.]